METSKNGELFGFDQKGLVYSWSGFLNGVCACNSFPPGNKFLSYSNAEMSAYTLLAVLAS